MLFLVMKSREKQTVIVCFLRVPLKEIGENQDQVTTPKK